LTTFDKMRLNHPERRIGVPLSSWKAIALIAVLILALLGGLFHRHASASESAACPICHAGGQTPVADLAGALAAPFLTTVGFVSPARSELVAHIFKFSKLIPRAPPIATHPVMFREGCAGLA
jgi:hypothetical protein